MSRLKAMIDPGEYTLPQSIGLLLVRLSAGGFMAYSHGWGKATKFFSDNAHKFPDPMGLGPEVSLGLAAFAELACALLVMCGALTRFALVPLIITMVVAAFVVHGGDPFGKREMALLYLFPYLALFFTGAGRLSLDEFLSRSR
jgi:putative oxidoreductase